MCSGGIDSDGDGRLICVLRVIRGSFCRYTLRITLCAGAI